MKTGCVPSNRARQGPGWRQQGTPCGQGSLPGGAGGASGQLALTRCPPGEPGPAHLVRSRSWGRRTRLGPRWAWQAGSWWRAAQALCSKTPVSGRQSSGPSWERPDAGLPRGPGASPRTGGQWPRHWPSRLSTSTHTHVHVHVHEHTCSESTSRRLIIRTPGHTLWAQSGQRDWQAGAPALPEWTPGRLRSRGWRSRRPSPPWLASPPLPCLLTKRGPRQGWARQGRPSRSRAESKVKPREKGRHCGHLFS